MMVPMRFLALIVLASFCVAQEKQPPRPMPAPTNLKILKATTGADVSQIMRTFTTGIGVQCVYCHVQGNFASDDNPKKEIARHMITMTQQINGNFNEGKLRVSCYTCHRGEPEPKTAPEPKAQ
jgi:hypothetical protein